MSVLVLLAALTFTMGGAPAEALAAPEGWRVDYLAGLNGQILTPPPNPQYVLPGGSTLPVLAVADPGYVFWKWAEDSSPMNPRSDANVTGDQVHTALFLKVVTVTADPKTMTYGDSDPPLSYTFTGFSGADTFTVAPSGRINGVHHDVGTYEGVVEFFGAGVPAGYIPLYVNSNLTVAKRSITVTADSLQKDYGDDDPALTYTITSGSLGSGDTAADVLTGSLIREVGESVLGGPYDIDRGTLALTGGVGTTNYNLTFVSGLFGIDTRDITVTADPLQHKAYGADDPTLAYTITSGSLVDLDAFTGALSRVAGEDAGVYDITVGTLTAGSNYDLHFISDHFTIDTRPISVTVDSGQHKTYGEADPVAYTYSVTSGGPLASGDSFTGALTRVAGEAAGSYTIRAGTLALPANYNLSVVEGTFTIDKKPITVTPDSGQTKVYGASEPTPFAYGSAPALESGDSFSGALSRELGEDVGSYAFTLGSLSAGANYDLSIADVDFTITAKPITVTVDSGQQKTYGEADPAAFTYQITSGGPLISGDSWSGAATRTAGENVGAYPIGLGTLELSANYAITFVPANFTITHRSITVTADNQTKVYGNPDPELTWRISSGTFATGDTTSTVFTGAITRDTGEGVADYVIRANTLTLRSGAGDNYSLTSVNGTLSITKRPITITPLGSKTYGYPDPVFGWTLSSGTMVGGDQVSGAATRTAGENVGLYPFGKGTLDAGPNYDLTFVSTDFPILHRDLTVTPRAGQTKIYGAPDPTFTWDLTSGELVEGDSITGDLARDTGGDVGNYSITMGSLTAGSNYRITLAAETFEIEHRDLTVTPRAGQSKIYGASDPTFTWDLTSGALAEGDSITGDLARNTGNDVGTYSITIGTLTADSNYHIALAAETFEIRKRDVTITPDHLHKAFGDSDPTLAYKRTSGDFAYTDTTATVLVGALTRVPGEAMGDYAISQGTLSLGGNYNLTVPEGVLTIDRRAVTVVTDHLHKTYGDADPALTFQITVGDYPGLRSQFSGGLGRVAGEDVGTYATNEGTLTLDASYVLTIITGTFTVDERPVTVTVDSGQHKTYGEADPVAYTYSVTSGGPLASGDSFTGALTRVAGEAAGSYTIRAGTLALPANYNLSVVEGTFTIDKRELTVTPNSGQSKTYGEADPSFAYGYTGSAPEIVPSFTGSLGRASGGNVGLYAFTLGNLSAGSNYDLTLTPGVVFTINAKPITVKANHLHKTYGDDDPSLTYEITSGGSLIGSDAFTGALTRELGRNVGNYEISRGSLSLGTNYDLTVDVDYLTIDARPITVTADDKTKVYGSDDPALTYRLSTGSFASWDTTADVLTGEISRSGAESVAGSPYLIGMGGLSLTFGPGTAGSNYSLTFVDGALSITPRPITVTADNKTKVYGSDDPELTYRLSSGSFAYSETTATVLTGELLRDGGNPVATYDIHQGTLALADDPSNYTLSFVDGTFTITKRPLTVTAEAKTKVYGALDPPLTFLITSGTYAYADTTSTAFTGGLARAAGESWQNSPYAITQGGLASANYGITFVGSQLTITKRPLTITGAVADNKEYDGNWGATINFLGASLTTPADGDDVSIDSSAVSAHFDNKLAGDDKDVTVTGVVLTGADAGNYTLAQPAGLTANITEKALTLTGLSVDTKTYNGNPQATVSFIGAAFVGLVHDDVVTFDSSAYDAHFSDEKVGTGKSVHIAGVTVLGVDALNYDWSQPSGVTGDIIPVNLTLNGTAVASDKPYDGNVTAAVNLSGVTLNTTNLVGGDTVALDVSGALATFNNANVGADKSVTVTGVGLSGPQAGNYTVTQPSGLTADITAIGITVTADDKTKVYGEADPALTWRITSGALMSGDATASVFSGSLTRQSGSTVTGSPYDIDQGSFAANGNYTLTFVGGDFAITLREITVAADDKSKIYGAADPALTYHLSTGSFASGDDTASVLAGALARDPGEAVDVYDIDRGTLALGGAAGANYALQFDGADFAITRAALTLTADAKTKVYGDADPALTFRITSGALASGDTTASAFSGALSRAAGAGVNTYAIGQNTLTAPNYDLTYVGADFTITAKPITVTATSGQTKVYGAADPTFAYTITSGGPLVGSDAFTGALSRAAGAGVGSYGITVGDLSVGSNYAMTFVPADFTITAKGLTVTAVDKSKVYGAADPTLTFNVSGFVGSDGWVTAPSGSIVGAHVNAGTYTDAILYSGGNAGGNYSVSYVPGDLTVTQKVLTVTADAKTKVYGAADPALTCQVTGFVGDDVWVTAPTGAITGAHVVPDVYHSAIVFSGGDAGDNYHVDYAAADLTVETAGLTVTAADKTKVIGASDPDPTFGVTGFLGEDGWDTPPTGEIVGTHTDTGVYHDAIVFSGGSATGYDITYVPGTLTVNPADPTGVSFGITSATQSLVTWTASAGATGYKVYVGTVPVGTVGPTVTSLSVSSLLGPGADVDVQALGGDDTHSSAVQATYVTGATTIRLAKIKFKEGSASLTSSARLALRRLALTMANAGFNSATVNGYVRRVGSSSRKRRLSLARAKAVKKYLAGRFALLHKSVAISAYGRSSTPWIGSSSKSSANRRAEVLVR